MKALLVPVLMLLGGCVALLGDVRLPPPSDGHELVARIAAVVHSGRVESRAEVYNHFGIDPRDPHGRIINPASLEDSRASGPLEWSMSYSGKDGSKGLNVIVWKTSTWCAKEDEVEGAMRFRFDRPAETALPGLAHTLHRDGSTEKVSVTFAADGCMTMFYAAIQ